MDASPPDNAVDYSPSSTVIEFDRPVPLLRGPLPAGPSVEPSDGPYVLAFRDSRAWASSFLACERKIVEQCEEGARIGCAVSASRNCKPTWWKALAGLTLHDLKEREECEVREMADCFAVAKDKCAGFAREKCLVPFRDARIRVAKGVLSSKGVGKLIGWGSLPVSGRNIWLMNQMGLIGGDLGMTNCKASELLGFDDYVQCILGEQEQGTEN
ncbi:uncharacterized protein LOC106757625 [Vigna radiata var. radiata]|uniref:Uncharacterized protein LOC106757625 n=1 Tax=Vigna radiata var. radiata TaxID=3916 RepID=A0A3Q0EUK9_VIGRR|nr:uncharacterized protein LOC106757625 [Vigna radiata var. radiata]XP_022634814.1 uncharacterized protein LOC106757625 [Vigna radiata var. radiata]XP_022634815.1 uncharacterized protein LOC106757625 [Vigna radiata var. radiata]XP_022634816.1 uncharacterized protein LOC106757625 [Vigna radiata var. radiata]XP_022634817.1 uncharacterized protein LOC106757625 [Vigna radiata var. radiata]XP_022634818.1 uncharacterized protein LOC106757625 [Vigna radiata var. radiata]